CPGTRPVGDRRLARAYCKAFCTSATLGLCCSPCEPSARLCTSGYASGCATSATAGWTLTASCLVSFAPATPQPEGAPAQGSGIVDCGPGFGCACSFLASEPRPA